MSSRSTASSSEQFNYKNIADLPSKIKKDANYIFLKNIQQIEVKKGISKDMTDTVSKVKQRVLCLSFDQVSQWQQILLSKIRQAHKLKKSKSLKQTLKILTFVCNQASIIYEKDKIEEIIKQIYFEEYGQEIVKQFKTCGFNTSQYETLVYDEPWYSKVFSFFVEKVFE